MSGDVCIIPPNSFALARTVEYFRIPRDVLTICLGKSTYARCGIIVNVTPLEPEWEGPRDARVLEYDAAARKDLRERGHRADDLLRIRRSLCDELQGPRRQVPGPAGRDVAEDLRAPRADACRQRGSTLFDPFDRHQREGRLHLVILARLDACRQILELRRHPEIGVLDEPSRWRM